MAAKKQAPKSPGGRQAAYTARNRAKLLQSAREVLAEIGPSATIEQLTAVAQVSPTTIYKYFETKDRMFAEALDIVWREWVVWSYNGEPAAQSLESVIDSARKLFWIRQTHPQFARIIRNTLSNPSFLIASVQSGGYKSFKELAERGVLKNQDFDKRIILWSNCLAGLLTAVHVNEVLSPTEAETAFGIGLSIWGISEAKAAKLMARPLVLAPVN
jgi:AcrR family transcriptional regulator